MLPSKHRTYHTSSDSFFCCILPSVHFLSAYPSQLSSNLLVAYLYRKDERALPRHLHSSRISRSPFTAIHLITTPLTPSSLLFFSLPMPHFYSPLLYRNTKQELAFCHCTPSVQRHCSPSYERAGLSKHCTCLPTRRQALPLVRCGTAVQ
jgi:hypothetical protein